MPNPPPKVVVAMSGGVDSSVAAALLRQRGMEVIGVFMRLGSPKGVQAAEVSCDEPAEKSSHKQGCCSVLDANDARRVAQVLDIPFYVLNFEDEFGKVIDYFVSEYNRGRTPNPCVRCNDWLKFGRLTQYAKAVGADFLASGHYARVGVDPVTGEKTLLRGLDTAKDQSDVLFGMTKDALAHTLLPIGEYRKAEVRKIAEELKLPVFNKPDSQEICFVPDQDYVGLLRRTAPDSLREGEFVSPNGEKLGRHGGHQSFTIGQRKGLGIALGHPIYVVDIDPHSNRVTLGEKEQLFKRGLVADGINILNSRLQPGAPAIPCTARIRHNHTPAAAIARVTDDGQLHVTFDEAQAAITPGQAVVIYDGDILLGGGWIDRAVVDDKN
jgi:tRNA-specific 2-thiouridylase